VINAIGINALPIIKYNSFERDCCSLESKFIRKEIESGSQGKDNTIHAIPTKINNRFFDLKYLDRIVNPIAKETITKIELKIPCKIITKSNNMHLIFYGKIKLNSK